MTEPQESIRFGQDAPHEWSDPESEEWHTMAAVLRKLSLEELQRLTARLNAGPEGQPSVPLTKDDYIALLADSYQDELVHQYELLLLSRFAIPLSRLKPNSITMDGDGVEYFIDHQAAERLKQGARVVSLQRLDGGSRKLLEAEVILAGVAAHRLTPTPHRGRPEMRLGDVIEFLLLCKTNDIEVWLDGGWGVDVLLGEQTRMHADLDVVIHKPDGERLRGLLEERGYRDVPDYDAHPWVFMLGDDHGHQIDIHVVELDANGDGLYGPPDSGIKYPAESLTGAGNLFGMQIKCISPEWQVKFHSGYKLTTKDRQDIQALCDRFTIPYPRTIPEEGTRWQALVPRHTRTNKQDQGA